MNIPTPGSQEINVDLNAAETMTCDECGNNEFVPTYIIKKVHALMSPTGKNTLAPIQVFKCGKCNHINSLFLEGITN